MFGINANVVMRPRASGRGWTTGPVGSVQKVSAQALNNQSPITEVQKNLAADNRVIPIIYGHAQIGGSVFALDYNESTGVFTVGYLICQGEIESFVSVYMDDAAPPAGVSINYYTGTSWQTADPLLSAAIQDYADDLTDLAYIVIQYGAGIFSSWPRVVVEIEGKKVYDPRTTLTAFTKNPALHLGDLLSSSEYGAGFTVDATALEAAADACDDTTGIAEARRESFSIIDTPRPPLEWAEVLRAYAGCFLVYRGQTAYLVPDRPAAVAATFTAADIIDGSLSITKKDGSDLPTVIQAYYTDTSGNEWRERLSDEAALTGAGSTIQRRVSKIRLTGVTRHSQAYREAVERLNSLTLSDLEVSFNVFDEGLELELGDVIAVTHPYGLTSKSLRITQQPAQITEGRWRIVAQEYDAAAYSDSVIEKPSTPDTTLPVNAPPAAPTGLTLSETTYQLQNGKYASRINVSWDASPSPYVTGYSVKVFDGASVVWATTVDSVSVSTSPLKELTPYTVEVRAITTLFTGEAITDSISIIGKTAIPDAPASLSGFEAGGEVRLSWPKSSDVDAERYEVRYGAVGGTWDAANSLDIVDGLRIVTKDVPEGTWTFYVKTIDSIQQYSTGFASTDLTVTLDNDAFTAGRIDPLTDHTVATNMRVVQESRTSTDEVAYSQGTDTWSSMFSGAAMSTFTNALASYQTAPVVTWQSQILDLVSDKSGNWSAVLPDYDLYNGTLTPEVFGVQPDGGAYDWSAQLSRQATARYARSRLTGTMNIKVSLPSGSMRADIVATEETGTATTGVGGVVTVTLSKEYAAARSIVVTPEGTTARSATYDNIVLDSGGFTEFDVYIFDSAGAPVVGADFRWNWKGV